MTKQSRNLPASVRARLLNVARDRREDFELVLVRFAIERLLYRLSMSEYAKHFVLKGAMLYVAWGVEGHRPTRDLDLLGGVPNDPEELARIFRYLCEIEVVPDGILFSSETVRAAYIREDSAYGGIRVQLTAEIARARIALQVDIGIGDVITPGPESIEYPTILAGFPMPKLDAYPVYTVIAEKLESGVRLGMANTRMKDYYDLRMFAERTDLDDAMVERAVRATFRRRRTEHPAERPLAYSLEFAGDADKQRQWAAFLTKNRLGRPHLHSLVDTVEAVWTAFGRYIRPSED